jgi:hypothetical protein
MKIIRIYVVIVITSTLLACVQTTPMPGYARPGDTIILGMGGVHRNANSELLIDKSDVTVTLTDVNGVRHDLLVELLFRSYPDHSSLLSYSAAYNRLGTAWDVEPFDGGWFVVASLVDADKVPLTTITAGPATAEVTSSKFVNTLANNEGDISNMPLDVLGGTSAYNENYVEQLKYYAPQANKSIQPQGLSTSDIVGAANYRLNFSNVDSARIESGLLDGTVDIYVVPASHNPFVQMNSKVVNNGDGTGYVDIYVLNPYGFYAIKEGGRKTSLHSDLAVQISLMQPGCATYTCTPAWNGVVLDLDIAKTQYYDINGDIMPGITAEFRG